MNGGLGAKLGDRFEAANMAHACAEMLLGLATRVTWEDPAGGDGIDLVVETAATVWGVQLKHRSGGPLGAGDLRQIRAEAQIWQNRSPRHRYRLRTDTSVGPLSRLLEITRLHTDPASWWTTTSADPTLLAELQAWGLSSDADLAARQELFARLRRVEVEIQDEALTWRQAHRRLADAGVQEPERAVPALIHLAWTHLGVGLDEATIRAALAAANIRIATPGPRGSLRSHLTNHATIWCDELERARGRLGLLPRTETDQVLEAVDATPRLIAVHGPAGCGKSQVLVAVVRAALDRGWTPLVMDLARLEPTSWKDDLGLGPDPLAALLSAAGDAPALLLIDQIDQALWSGRGPGSALTIVQQLLERARRLGCTVIVGCRSVDCRDSRLAPLLAGFAAVGAERPDKEIAVGDLPMTTVETELIAAHIAPGELDPTLLPIVQRPILLRLLLEIARRNGATLPGLRSTLDLLRTWHGQIANELAQRGIQDDARRVEQKLVDLSLSLGIPRVPAERILPGDDPIVEALVEVGLLLRSIDHRWITWTHQTLLDHAVVLRWQERLDEGKALAELVGPRIEQDLTTAARLRLFVGASSQDPQRILSVSALMLGEGLRPMCRFGILRGLAALENDADRASWTDAVNSWLSDPRLANWTVRHLLAGDASWMGLLQSWLRRTDHAIELRPVIIGALSLAATTWGTGVASVLQAWGTHDPDLVREAAQVFWQSPAADSPELFAMRLERIRHGLVVPEIPCEWSELLRLHPVRMAQLLAAMLPRIPVETWEHARPLVGLSLCKATDAVTAGWRFLEPMLDAWRSINLQEWTCYGEGVAWTVFELIGAAAGGAGTSNQLSWDNLAELLPGRWQDAHVRVIAAGQWPEAPADSVITWLADTPNVWMAPLSQGNRWQWAERAISLHAPRASRHALDHLQEQLCTQQIPHALRNSDQAATATFLLAAISAELRTNESAAWLAKHHALLQQERWRFNLIQGGTVRSDITDEDASTMDDDSWLGKLKDVIDKPPTWNQIDRETVASSSMHHYVWQLHQITARDPQRGLRLLDRLDNSRYDEARASIAEAILNRSRTEAKNVWSQADRMAAVLLMVERGWRVCDRAIATCVAQEDSASWPTTITSLLCELVIDHTNNSDTRTWAWTGLKRIARSQPEQQAVIWQHIQGAPIPEDSPRIGALRLRATEACSPVNLEGCWAQILVLTTDPAVAMEPEALPLLLWHIHKGNQPDLIVQILKAQESTDAVTRKQAGAVLISLAVARKVPANHVDQALRRANLEVIRGMASGLTDILRGSPDDWPLGGTWPSDVLETALRLAAFDDEETMRTMSHIWYMSQGTVWDSQQSVRRLLEAPGFRDAFARTLTITRYPEPLLNACEQVGQLIPVLPLIVQVVTNACQASPRWNWSLGETLVRIVSNCLEEAETQGTPADRTSIMDLWDELLIRGLPGTDQRISSLLA